MQQYYTLEEAASKLQLSPDALREMAKTKKVRAFQDRGSWRFRAQEIDELARERGLGSDPELQLGDSSAAARQPAKGAKHKLPEDEDKIAIDFSLESGTTPKPGGAPKSGPKSPQPKKGSDSDVRLIMDSNLDFQIDLDSDVRLEQQASPKPGSKKSKVQPGEQTGDKKPSDSDVKVVPATHDSDVKPRQGKSPSDSDIRLQDAAEREKRKSDAHLVTEEIIDLDAETAKAAPQKPGTKKPKVTQAANPPILPTNSPFELSEPDVHLQGGPPTSPKKGAKQPAKAKGDTDSSSDFEMVSFDSPKSPGKGGAGEIPLLADDDDVVLGDLGAPGTGNSGINLKDPADSGISLESGGSDEFELSLDSGAKPKPAKKQPAKQQPAKQQPAKKKPAKTDDDSSSEFELSLDDSPSDPSSSEFELSLDDSGDSINLADDASSSSQFELTLDDEGGLAVEDSKDIFEPTNFDVPALDDESGSEAVAIDEAETDIDSQDFEISLEGVEEGSDSQVVALESEEEADTGAATVARPRKSGKAGKAQMAKGAVDDADELDLDLEMIDSPKKKPKKPVAEPDIEDDDSDDEVAVAQAVPAEWGPLPAMFLIPTVVVLFLVGFMSFELVQGMFGYSRPGNPGRLMIDTIARPVADAMDAKLPE